MPIGAGYATIPNESTKNPCQIADRLLKALTKLCRKKKHKTAESFLQLVLETCRWVAASAEREMYAEMYYFSRGMGWGFF